MTPPLFLLDELPAGDELVLGGDEGRHAARVQRLRRGEALLVSDGRGGVLDCRVVEAVEHGLALAVVGRRTEARPEPRVVVVQALPKGDRAELAVETMTELGVDGIVPWQASRCVVQWHGPRGERALDRWRRTAREAAKQSRRSWVPDVGRPADTAAVTDLVAGASAALVLHEDAVAGIGEVALPQAGELVLVVGPEGGLSSEEIDAFEAAGAHAVRLGPTVLRTSTAGSAALAAVSLRLGRWR